MPPVRGDLALRELHRPPASALASATGGLDAPAGDAWAAVPRRRLLAATASVLRPRQWIKNGLVVAAAGAAGALGHDDVPVRVGLACIAFCLLASGIYAVNDVRDAAEDRLHPRKRYRAVAAGELSPAQALALGSASMLAGITLCWSVRPLLALVGAAYVVLTLTYTLIWRRIPIFDVVAIGGGFVLRAVAGGVAAPVALSRWFVLVVSAAAVLIAAGKRHAELRRADATGTPRRRVLAAYTPFLLWLIIAGSAAVALFAYSVWAFELPAVDGVPWRPLTILPFAGCLIRYVALVRNGSGEAPEELLLTDRSLQIAGAAWLVLFALGVHAAG